MTAPFSYKIHKNPYDVNKMLTTSLKGLNGKGGGHKLASGAIVNKSDFEIFKKRIEDYVKENK